MLIAVACIGGEVAGTLIRAEEYALFDVRGGRVVARSHAHVSDRQQRSRARHLYDIGVEMLLCGRLDREERRALFDCGVNFADGVGGSAENAIARYLQGALFD